MKTDSKGSRYMVLLLAVAGLGGLLYGIDVGIIAGALPYLEATSGLNAGQLSFIVAAVLLGSVISTLFAGMLADWMGRKKLMAISGVLFVASIPMIALAHGYGPLVLGRLLQGVSAGLIGVVIPLYLAECLDASNRGKGTGIFQWLLTLGIVAAALIGMGFSVWLDRITDVDSLFAAKDTAWRSIFWVSLPPGILFVIGSFMVAESPRWLFRKGRKDAARVALLRSRTEEQADNELREMAETEAAEKAKTSSTGEKVRESLLRRKYVIPFVLACIILACNQATGVNSIIGYNATILIQAGLGDKSAHIGYVILTVVNFLVTMAGVALVDRKGRKFLLSIGSAGIIASLIATGFVFGKTEAKRVDVQAAVQAADIAEYQDVKITIDPSDVAAAKTAETSFSFLGTNIARIAAVGSSLNIEFTRPVAEAKLVSVDSNHTATIEFALADGGKPVSIPANYKLVKAAAAQDGKLSIQMGVKIAKADLAADQKCNIALTPENMAKLLATAGEAGKAIGTNTATMVIIYSVGDYVSATKTVRSDDPAAALSISRNDTLPSSSVDSFFKNPFADLKAAKSAPLKINNALITPVPSEKTGWVTAVCIFCFMAFFAVGPGVCVWLALSELMPTRIRSNGMSIALLINQAVSTTIAAVFLPTVGKYGYSTMFFVFAGCTVVYFITAAFFLPETKGKTLEEIEEHFEGKKKA